jgi:hypothetical protein
VYKGIPTHSRLPRSIADDVVLVALCGVNEGWVINRDGLPMIPVGLDAAVAGAYLIELELSSLIERRGAEIVTTQRQSHPDVDLAALAQRIAAERRARSAWWWIKHITDRQPHLRQLERLRRLRLVAEYENLVRGVFGKRPVKYCFAPDWGSEGPVMELLTAAVRGQKSDARTVGLLALLCAADLHDWFMPEDATIKRRLEDLVRNHWIANPVADFRWRQLLPPPF